jgi:hypothetical protein
VPEDLTAEWPRSPARITKDHQKGRSKLLAASSVTPLSRPGIPPRMEGTTRLNLHHTWSCGLARLRGGSGNRDAARKAQDGQVYHALNRSVGRMHLLRKDADFETFQHVFEALRRDPIRMLSCCVVSNHWHFVVWPETDGQVTKKKGRGKGVQCAPMPPNWSRGDVTRSRRCRATLSHLFQRRGGGMSTL